MKIDFTQPILDENNEPVKEGMFKTIRSTCTTALFAQIKGDENLSPDKKGEMGFLGLQIQHSDTLDLKVEQVAMIKSRIGMIAPNLIVYRAFELLDPKEGGKEVAKSNGADHQQPAA